MTRFAPMLSQFILYIAGNPAQLVGALEGADAVQTMLWTFNDTAYSLDEFFTYTLLAIRPAAEDTPPY